MSQEWLRLMAALERVSRTSRFSMGRPVEPS